jgi:mono/diheme cytochrome c family protein
MKGCILIVGVLVSAVSVAAFGQTSTTTAGETTVRDRVYTDDQAKSGRSGYDAKCSSCHDGGTMGPELWGAPFLEAWDNKTVSDFFNRIQTTMPEDSPGTLSDKEVLDIVAYVLKTNGFPPGEQPIEKSALAAMKFVRAK